MLAHEAFQLVRYVIVGGSASLAHLTIGYALGHIAPVGVASAFGAIVGFAISLTGHHYFTFRSQSALGRSARRFVVASVVTASVIGLVAEVSRHLIGGVFWPVAISVAAGPLVSFPLSRFWVFASAR